MRVGIAGADNFVGRNLCIHMQQAGRDDVVTFTPAGSFAGVDAIIYVADAALPGPVDDLELACAALGFRPERPPLLIHAVATHADLAINAANAGALVRLREAAEVAGADLHTVVFPTAFGKWCPPGAAAPVANLCDAVAHGRTGSVDCPGAQLSLTYVDDLVATLVAVLHNRPSGAAGTSLVEPRYETTYGEVAALIKAFRESRENHVVERVGRGLVRALYSTYLSYLDPADFAYPVIAHTDPRGSFAEMLRTKDSGQVSFFTAGPGVTRGGHFHHSKTEKFLVMRGRARFRFRHILSGETHSLDSNGANLRIVETVPGWTHDITNVGEDEILVMLWANEQFDPANPDTYSSPLSKD